MIERVSTKTEFERWLNKNPPSHDPRYLAIRCRNKNWGAWLRHQRADQFSALYEDYWLKHPEKWDEVYDS